MLLEESTEDVKWNSKEKNVILYIFLIYKLLLLKNDCKCEYYLLFFKFINTFSVAPSVLYKNVLFHHAYLVNRMKPVAEFLTLGVNIYVPKRLLCIKAIKSQLKVEK